MNKFEKIINQFNKNIDPDIPQIPSPTVEDEGKVAKVIDGVWGVGEAGGGSGGFIARFTYGEEGIACDTDPATMVEKAQNGELTGAELDLGEEFGSDYKMLFNMTMYSAEENEGFGIIHEIVFSSLSGNTETSINGYTIICDVLLGEDPIMDIGLMGTNMYIESDRLLPRVSSSDNGKILGVKDGYWQKVDSLPSVTSSDNGKVLGVNNGAWEKVDISIPSEVIIIELKKVDGEFNINSEKVNAIKNAILNNNLVVLEAQKNDFGTGEVGNVRMYMESYSPSKTYPNQCNFAALVRNVNTVYLCQIYIGLSGSGTVGVACSSFTVSSAQV